MQTAGLVYTGTATTTFRVLVLIGLAGRAVFDRKYHSIDLSWRCYAPTVPCHHNAGLLFALEGGRQHPGHQGVQVILDWPDSATLTQFPVFPSPGAGIAYSRARQSSS